ncbi:hypothetical protein [Nocardia carnea]|uniref:hypothetical protein n=1 Tax=Nocardia carnea TaxID=37328 RepID=UPI002454A74B|nr:hypothetical protein [Nocardia carnea]
MQGVTPGLNLLAGQTGQISLGHGAFLAIRAYSTAVMLDRWDAPHIATVPVAAPRSRRKSFRS